MRIHQEHNDSMSLAAMVMDRQTPETILSPWGIPNKELPTKAVPITMASSLSDTYGVETLSTTSSDYAALHGIMKDPSEERNKTTLLQLIRRKLFEREEHEARLHEAFDRCIHDRRGAMDGQQSQREVVLITGSAGTGKSTLARRTLDAAIQAAGDPKSFLLYGKCDQIPNSEPLVPFVQAFTQFVNDVLDRDATLDGYSRAPSLVADSVRDAIENATDGSDIELLTDMIPAFGKILAKDNPKSNRLESEQTTQDPVSPAILGQDGGRLVYNSKRSNRTRAKATNPGVAVVCKLLQELCANEGFRIVLLIDDLQWLDSNSIQMFEAISFILHSVKNFMVVGTCRPDDVDIDHQLTAMFQRLNRPDLGVVLVEIRLQNLHRETVTHMLAEWLNVQNLNVIHPLAELTYLHSDGNPFFIVEQIRALVEKRLLFYKEGKWMWDEGEILRHSSELGETEISDVLVQSAICRSSDPSHETLQIAACLGTEFTAAHVTLVATSSSRGILRALNVLLEKGLIMATSEVGRFRWAHDKFQKSAFSLISQDNHDAFLYSIGKKLRDRLPEEELISNVFLVVKLLDNGIRFVQSEEELEQMAGLLCIAGTKAAQASAFEDAASYFRKGIDLLPPGHWERDASYALSQQLYNCSAEMECCLGNGTKVDELVETILTNSRCLQDQLRAYDTQIYSLSSRNEMIKSIRVGLDVLRQLGESVPRRPTLLLNIKELVTTTLALRRVKCEDVLCLRPMRNWQKAAVLQIINLVFPSVLRSQPEYALFLVAKGVKLTMRYGLSPVSSTMFSAFGMMVCHPVGFVEEGRRYEEIGWRIFEKFGANDLRSRIYVMRYAYVKPWGDSMKASLPALVTGANSGMMTGDFEIAFINYFEYSLGCLLAGVALREHYKRILHIKQQFVGLGQETVMFYLDCAIQLTQNLLGLAKDAHVLSGELFDAQQALHESLSTSNPSGVSFVSLLQLFLALFTNNYHEAVKTGRKLQKCNTDSFGAMEVQYFAFMLSLSEMIVARETKSRNHLWAGNRALRQLEKWTKYTPDSWLNRIHLVRAERDALQGRYEEATRNFFSSVDFAGRHGWVHEQALALERAGIFLVEIGQMAKGLDCLYRSRDLYDTWGCVIKCNKVTDLISGRIATRSEHPCE
jgi:predicted ATPase